uniref:Uncharacterized protein n=1 Tax=Candidatus Kentrum sp. UNK TaxID=2126344 RepID=A0A450ZXM3_9GAMM|nr:MAG: hypothetical protein BECKUNK1418G_GA0071005_100341 [Candidatus Kentron sp. UNK]VFK71633.1 MAG: hypothetical protein BECKUNK1418H_GA0071006_107511 [Candidatus Kentron sp. UNK]
MGGRSFKRAYRTEYKEIDGFIHCRLCAIIIPQKKYPLFGWRIGITFLDREEHRGRSCRHGRGHLELPDIDLDHNIILRRYGVKVLFVRGEVESMGLLLAFSQFYILDKFEFFSIDDTDNPSLW